MREHCLIGYGSLLLFMNIHEQSMKKKDNNSCVYERHIVMGEERLSIIRV